MLDDFLSIIQKKFKRLCYELLIRLDCDPPDMMALRALYLEVIGVENELTECFGSAVPVSVEAVFADFSEVFEETLSSLAKPIENNEPDLRIMVNPVQAGLRVLSRMMALVREDVNATFSQRMNSSEEELVWSQEQSREQPEDADSKETEIQEEQAKEEEQVEEEKQAEEEEQAEEEKQDSKGEFARLMDLLGELMMSKSVFQNLSRQALLEYNLPFFSKEIKANGNKFVGVMERLEETVLGLCSRYTNLVFQKRKVLPFVAGEQAFFIEVNQVMEVVRISQQEIFRRRGRFFYPFRGETLSLVFLSDFFGRTAFKKPESMGIVVITDGRKKLGIGVEHWSIEQEVLVKPLGDIFASQREIAGAAVLEDGQISLMLDGAALISKVSLEKEQED